MTDRVWAPKADRVELVVGDDRMAMHVTNEGWWVADREPRPGERYGFSLDGGPVRPDPRSRFQPDGVHALSQVVDPSSYAWQHGGFRAHPLAESVLYELHIGTFTPGGTLASAIERLDHLVDLGVTHASILPLNAFEGRHGWGYDGVLWMAPHAPYCGEEGPNAVRGFVDACHGRGLSVLIDVVYNHLGPSGNYLNEFGPYTTDAYRTPWGPAINLDGPGSDEVRRLVCDSALMWLDEYRFDGLRVDAVHAFHDRSATHLLEQLTDEVRALSAKQDRPLVVIAESDLNDPRVVTAHETGGLGCDAQWSDDFHHAVHAHVTGETRGYYADFADKASIAEALRHAYVYRGQRSEHRERTHGRPADHLPTDRFLAYIQNHDQVGNRAVGDRIGASASPDALRVAAAVMLLGPFVPMLFQGEEWNASTPFPFFADHDDEGLREAVRTGRRAEFASFGWDAEDIPDPEAPATYESAKLDWSERQRGRHATMLDWYRELIALRKRAGAVSGKAVSATRVSQDAEGQWLAFRVGDLIVACTLPGTQGRVEVPIGVLLDAGEALSELAVRSTEGVALAGESIVLTGVGCGAGLVDRATPLV